MTNQNNSQLIGIREITEKYLPISRRRARKFVALYLEPKRIGHRIFVDRGQLERLLNDPNRERFPLDF